MSFNNPYQNQIPYHGYNMNNNNNPNNGQLPSLHEQSPYRPPPPMPQQYRMSNLPPPQPMHTEHYGQPPQQPPLPSMYESRKLYTCNEPGCSEYFDQAGGLRIHQRFVAIKKKVRVKPYILKKNSCKIIGPHMVEVLKMII